MGKLDGLLTSHKQQEKDTKRSHEPTAKLEKSIDMSDTQKNSTELNYIQIEAPVSTSLSSVDELEQKVLEYLGKNDDGNFVCKICGKVDKVRYEESVRFRMEI